MKITSKLLMLSLIVVVLGWTGCKNDESPDPTAVRYLDEMFDVDVDILFNKYAEADALVYTQPYSLSYQPLTYSQNLNFHLYQPENDTETNRPLVIFAFGGAYLLGTPLQPQIVNYARNLAKRGYVVACIEYRLGFDVFDENTAIRALYRGSQDMVSAIRYFKGNAAEFGIDPDMIFIGGNSAGAVSSLHAAYASEAERAAHPLMAPTYVWEETWPDLGGVIDGNKDNSLGYETNGDYSIAAVLNLWGALGDLSIIDSPSDKPIISFFGSDDTTVSPNSAAPFEDVVETIPDIGPLENIGFPVLHGANPIHAHLNSMGIYNEKYEYAGEGHEPWTDGDIAHDIQDKSAEFMYYIMNL